VRCRHPRPAVIIQLSPMTNVLELARQLEPQAVPHRGHPALNAACRSGCGMSPWETVCDRRNNPSAARIEAKAEGAYGSPTASAGQLG